MPQRERHKTKYPNVYYVEEKFSGMVAIGLEPDEDSFQHRREDEQQLPVVLKSVKALQQVFYIRYRASGKDKTERIGGTAWECITASEAADILKLRKYQTAAEFSGVDVKATKKIAEANIVSGRFKETINKAWIMHRLFHKDAIQFKQEKKLFNKYLKPLACPYLIERYVSGTGKNEQLYLDGLNRIGQEKPVMITEKEAYYPGGRLAFGWDLTSPWYVADVIHEMDLSPNIRRQIFLLLAKLARDYLDFDREWRYGRFPSDPPIEDEDRPGREELANLMLLIGYEINHGNLSL